MNALRTFIAMLAVAIVGATFVQADAAGRSGQLVVVQAVPGLSVAVAIDGRTVRQRAGVAAVLGPFELSPGSHVVRFVDQSGDVTMSSRVQVRAGASSDVVLHRPASLDGDPVVNVYRTPSDPIGPGKARVIVAHTATVPPADVRVDGQTIFTNIANGEFAEAEVPAGPHEVALYPTGATSDPILGPLEFSLVPRTVTMVYAVGNPSTDSMDFITSSRQISSDGTVAPERIDTGSVGLARAGMTPFAPLALAPSRPVGCPGAAMDAWLELTMRSRNNADAGG